MFKNTNTGIAFKTTTSLHQFIRPKKQTHIPDHEKSGIHKITCNTCHKAYVGQTSRNLKSRYQEHIRYIKKNDPRSALKNKVCASIW
jgi:inhibitor of KinA sporulation pathway (predicted exonuclease)